MAPAAADPAKRIAELRTLLARANTAYFVDLAPIMSDREFDDLLAQLARLEAEHPELDDPASPTRRQIALRRYPHEHAGDYPEQFGSEQVREYAFHILGA